MYKLKIQSDKFPMKPGHLLGRFSTLPDASTRLPQPIRAGGRRAGGPRRCRRGSITLEFGLVVLPFIVFVAALTEIVWQVTTASVLDAAALRASRFGITGQQRLAATPPALTCRSLAIPWLISHSTGNFLKSSRITVTSQSWATLGSQRDAAAPTTGAGQGGQVAVYTVEYRQPYLTLGFFGAASHRIHRATVTVMNEPFSNAVC